jgi:hypothetical protein
MHLFLLKVTGFVFVVHRNLTVSNIGDHYLLNYKQKSSKAMDLLSKILPKKFKFWVQVIYRYFK